MKTFNRVFTVIVFLFLYIPMIVLAVASFNAGTDIAVWKGFTFAQYGALFRDGVLLPLLANCRHRRGASPRSWRRCSAPWPPSAFAPCPAGCAASRWP